MATLTIRRIDDHVKQALRRRAARHGRSMEAEVRAILGQVLREDGPTQRGLGTRIIERVGEDHVDLELPPRDEPPRAVDLSR